MKISLQKRLSAAVLLMLVWVAFSAAHATAQDLEELEELAMKAAVRKASSSVVAIETLGGLEKVGKLLVGTGPTTGTVVSEDGYILSSAFNFVQKPSSILVTLPSGKRVAAKIVARDHSRMLVLLKIDTDEKLVVPQAVPRSETTVGEWTLAMGRTYDVKQINVSVGVLSAKNRIWGKAIQTDAKISPNNYGGPLVDIHGRVLGVLVPLSPRGANEIAGAEWYDSGIGFAVPLAEINKHLEKMKKGEDLHPGIMGVSLKGRDVYANKAAVAACPANSPAANAGIKPGDVIVEFEGAKITRQAQLKHAVGHRYAGETVSVVVLRGKERIETTIKLTDKLVPYEHPFLGVLPLRGTSREKGGVVVRYVYPGSPAAEAGVVVNDRLMQLGGKPIVDAAAMQDAIAQHGPGEKVTLKLQRGDKTLDVSLSLAALPTAIPEKLPNARQGEGNAELERPAVGIVEIKIPEENNECIAYIPESYRADVPHGVVVWLHAPDDFDQEQLIARWKNLCEKNSLILLAPKSADPKKWVATEAAFVRKVLDQVLNDYNVDRTRIVAHGYQAGGTMAYMVAFAQRDLVRGVAVCDASLPARARPPSNDPVQRLAFYSTLAAESKLAKPIQASAKRLESMKYPVTVKDLDGQARYLNTEELAELVRWIDTLDRI